VNKYFANFSVIYLHDGGRKIDVPMLQYLAAICGIRLSKNQINPRLNRKKPYLEVSDQPVFGEECK